MKKLIIPVVILASLVGLLYLINSFTGFFSRNRSALPPLETKTSQTPTEDIPRLSVVAENLVVPWALAFLPDGSLLVTERPGAVKRIRNGTISEIAEISVHNEDESGLHGIAVDPDYATNNYIYLYYTTRADGANTINRVSRFTLSGEALTDETILIDDIPGARFHDGGRIKFGPDGYLYVTTGDAREPSLSQNTDSLAGKILRIDTNGNPAPDNPFGNAIYSYGHRNPQGITWTEDGSLFATEHGNQATDEFNQIQLGGNYGWPIITGDQSQTGMIAPILQSGSTTWAPGGITHHEGTFYFAGLRGNALFAIKEADGNYSLTTYLENEYGRIRDVVVGPDGMLYITTSNHDGRGIPEKSDDRIFRINPEKL